MKKAGRLAALFLVLALVPTASRGEEAMREALKNYLTEIAGYTEEETGRMTFVPLDPGPGVACTDEAGIVYRIRPGTGQDAGPEVEDPLSGTGLLPWRTGLATVREGIRLALGNAWFTDCREERGTELYDFIRMHLSPDAAQKALMDAGGPLSVREAIHLYFTSAFGERYAWSEDILAWEKHVLETCGEDWTPPFLPEQGGKFVWQSGEERYETFAGELPGTLSAISDVLRGRRLVCGALHERNRFVSHALLCAEQEGVRVLAYAERGRGEDSWQVYPVGDACLLQEGDVDIGFARGNRFVVRMAPDSSRQVRLLLDFTSPGGRGVHLAGVDLLDAGNETVISLPGDGGDGTKTEKGRAVEGFRGRHLPALAEYLSLADVMEEPEDAEEDRWTGSWGMPSAGVHFRRDHSSHSGDLGVFRSGVVVPVFATTPGTEAEWYHVHVGAMEGWVSGNYMKLGEPSAGAEAPAVAMAVKDTGLYAGTGLFDRKTGSLEKGELVYILLERGAWRYVLLPVNGISLPMQLEGSYGWVRERDLLEGAAPGSFMWTDLP